MSVRRTPDPFSIVGQIQWKHCWPWSRNMEVTVVSLKRPLIGPRPNYIIIPIAPCFDHDFESCKPPQCYNLRALGADSQAQNACSPLLRSTHAKNLLKLTATDLPHADDIWFPLVCLTWNGMCCPLYWYQDLRQGEIGDRVPHDERSKECVAAWPGALAIIKGAMSPVI